MTYIYGVLTLRDRAILVDGEWLGDIHLHVFQRLLDEMPPGEIYLAVGQDSLCSSPNCHYDFQKGCAVNPLHGGLGSRHWIGTSSVYPTPTMLDTAYRLPGIVFRRSLLELYLDPDVDKSVGLWLNAINVYLQDDGWSCGYRTCAYMFLMAMGDTPEALCDAYFDSEELREWLLKCLSERKLCAPPQQKAPTHARRVFGGAYAPVQRLHIQPNEATWEQSLI
jgi:hypothetical protein